jgi:Protein of unknown function (DUF3223)
VAKPVILNNGKQWPTKKAATAHFSAMLARYANGQRVTAADADDLRALLVRYDKSVQPGQATKIGSGISHFTRELNVGAGYATPGFHVHRIDNTSDDFSFWDAVRIDPP